MTVLAPVIDIARTAQNAPSLFAIVDHLEALFTSLDGLEDPELRQQCEAEIDVYLATEVQKVDRICDYLAHCETMQAGAAAEIKRMQDRKRRFERNQERVEASVLRVMQCWGMPKIEGKLHSLHLKKCPPSVEVLDIAAVPDQYKRITVTEAVDKTAAKVELAAGGMIAGLRLVTEKYTVRRS